MPGIVGIISKRQKENNEQKLHQMVQSMMHESFYNQGTVADQQAGLFVGWVCHEGSFCDCMPVWNEKKNVLMIFFGENFTDLEIFDTLKAKHHRFDRNNASYLVHLYEESGISFLEQLNGWFSGLLCDFRSNDIYIFNDRYGMQRIFYHENDEGFYFASEIKAIQRAIPELKTIDLKGFGELLCCGCTLENRTIFNKVNMIPGGSAWQFQEDRILIKNSYFQPEVWENQPWLEKDFYFEKLKATFAKIVHRYFRTKNQKIGISLTGGLDTRVIMAYANMTPNKYPCYTFGGKYRECYDVKVARKVAAASQQSHQTLVLNNDFLSEFSRYLEKTIYISDGYFGAFNAYEVYLNSLAREIAPIRMTGNYGGEILRGIAGKLKGNTSCDWFLNNDIKDYLKSALEKVAYLNETAKHPITHNLFKEIPWFRNLGFVCEQSQLTVRTPYLDNDLVALMYRAPMDARNNPELTLRLISEGNPKLASILTDRGFGGTFPMSAIIELYLDFLFKAEYVYNYGMPQWLSAIDYYFKMLHFEKLFIGRHKFAHFRLWFRDELSEFIKGVLLDYDTLNNPLFKKDAIEEIANNHTQGKRNYTNEISTILNIVYIHKLML